MTSDRKFFLRLAIAGAALVVIGFFPVRSNAATDSMVWVAALTGFAMSLGNVLAGFAGVKIARSRGGTEFNMIVFGSMTVRMLLMLALIFFVVQYVALPVIPFVASLFLSYMVFLAIEIQFLWSSSRQSQTAPSTNV